MGIERIAGGRGVLPFQPTLIFRTTGPGTTQQTETPEERRERLQNNKPDNKNNQDPPAEGSDCVTRTRKGEEYTVCKNPAPTPKECRSRSCNN